MNIKVITIYIILSTVLSGYLFAQENVVQITDTIQGSENEKGMVNLPFSKTSADVTAGAIKVLNPEEILKYDNVGSVNGLLQSRVPGLMGGNNLRGVGNTLVVVDGVPRPISSVNVQEIEQITVLKGAHAAMLYGVQGKTGVTLITTKRGKAFQKKTSVLAEYGIGQPLRLPEYLGAADYMELYNEATDNDGVPRKYDPMDIEATRMGDNSLRYPDTDYYGSEFLNNTKPYMKAVAEFLGGDNNASYYVNAGWSNSGSLLKLFDENTNRLNLRSNIDFKINNFIRSNIDVVAIYERDKGPNSDFWSDASQLRPNLYPPLIDSSMVSSAEILGAANFVKGHYLLGGTSQYQNNMYGNLLFGGFSNETNATGQFSNGIDVDLNSITKGLSLHTNVSFDYMKYFIEGQNNQYAIYEPTWVADENFEESLELTKIGDDKFTGNQSLSGSVINRRIAFMSTLNYSRMFDDKHKFSGMILAYADKYQATGVLQDVNHTHLGANLNYVYDNKYIVDFNSALVYSIKLPDNNRVGLSPSLAVSWIASNEEFLKGNNIIDYLKVNVSAGSMNTDLSIEEYYLYKNTYTVGYEITWGDNTRSNSVTEFSNLENMNLFYEKRNEINLGFQATLFDNSLGFDINYFYEHIKGKPARPTNFYPEYLGGFIPVDNYEEDKYSGIEAGIDYYKSFGDFKLNIGVDFTYVKSEALVRDELYEYDYQYRVGKPVSAMFGLQADGLFADYDDINAHETQLFGDVKPGDIKYVDQNDDGVIDQNDAIQVGKSTPDVVSGLRIRLSYKSFELFAMATGSFGYDRYASSEYYWINGDMKYSNVVLGRWTYETASTATFPRLSSQTNSNNFRSSTYWLYDNSRITLNTVQLNYRLPANFSKSIGFKNLSIYGRGSNLVKFAENRDKIELNVVSEPQYRYYTMGIKVVF